MKLPSGCSRPKVLIVIATATNYFTLSIPLNLLAYLMKPRTLHVHLQRLPIADIPIDHESLRSWCVSRFALKDK